MKRFSLLVLSLIACLLSSVSAAFAEEVALNFGQDLPTDASPAVETTAEKVAQAPAPVEPARNEPAVPKQDPLLQSPTAPATNQSAAVVVAASPDALSFNVPKTAASATPAVARLTPVAPPAAAPAEAPAPAPSPETLFAGGSDSLVARTVGHAEGTRTAEGNKTAAYYGHSDPGNGVWNLGSFSFQHCREARYRCSTPQQADVHQLRRLQGQAQALRQRAAALGMTLTLEEELNGIDLANQAPLAALGQPEAYPEHLARARKQGLTGEDAILEGRVWGYWDGDRGRWAAPGLGNTEANIRHDQRRRMVAIARALAHQERQFARREENADRIIAQNLAR